MTATAAPTATLSVLDPSTGERIGSRPAAERAERLKAATRGLHEQVDDLAELR